MSSGVTLDTLQDKQMPNDFVDAERVGIRVIMVIDMQSCLYGYRGMTESPSGKLMQTTYTAMQ